MKPMKIVSLARDVKRPTTKEWIKAVFDDFIELHGDRYYADDKALVGGIATLNGNSCYRYWNGKRTYSSRKSQNEFWSSASGRVQKKVHD